MYIVYSVQIYIVDHIQKLTTIDKYNIIVYV